ncbi:MULTISPECIES: folate/biopterin family MFS transporter [Kamptonema]|uniref:folate/biopterin family MFS transporter n=1 Tax=Kamptonema TaxID=1501433 RepID=UPI0001DAC61A|nr:MULTISPECIES: folate/biopterin family MFS transporter [Kamptonema]CBN59095.1 folate/biopterin transporter [Kamptonema sp. PCC 6506]
MLSSSSGRIKLKDFLKEKIFFGNEPTPELIALLLIYFVQGILGLARLAVSFFLKDQLGMSPVEVSAMLGVTALPWVIKPLFGFMSDGLPIFGYRRRPYIILSGLLGTSAWIALATIVHSPWAATATIAFSSLSVAVSDVIADSLVVERARKESAKEAGSLQSLSSAATAIGGLITAYLSGFLLERFSSQTIFLITASFPLIVSAAAWLIIEERVSDRFNFNIVKQQFTQLRQTITQKSIWLPTAFIFLWQATPSADSALFFFTTNELGFQPEFLGRLHLVTSFASLAGVWLFQRFFRSIPFRVMFGWSIVLSTTLGMTTLLLITHTNRSLGIDDRWFSLGDGLILTVIGKIAFMPILVLCARLCPKGVEASLFALLISISNVGFLLSYESGALLMHWLGITETNFDKLWLLATIANLSTLLPLPFLGWLPSTNLDTEPEEGYHSSIPLLQPEMASSKIVGQHFMPEFLPDLVPTIQDKFTAEDPK